MTATNGQEYYETAILKLDDYQDEENGFVQNDTSNFDSEEDDSAGGDVDTDESIIIDEDGQTSPAFRKKTKLEYEENYVKNVDTAITSEISNEEKIDEFDDPDYESNVTKPAKGTAANDPASFKCKICSYQTNRKFLLSQHLITHSDKRPFKCDLCGKSYKRKAVLQKHINTHSGCKPNACSNCDMAFTTPEDLIKHERNRHIKSPNCTKCDYSSVDLRKLRRHMRSHTDKRPYQCPHCTYAAKTISCLKSHMDVHTGENPYECDICHARFKQQRSLTHHRLTHSEPAIQCHLCPTTCFSKWHLRLHIKRLHSSNQPIPCKLCGKELPDRHSYNTHRKTHNGEKFYRCEYCPFTAKKHSRMKLHVFVHLDVKRFTCEICESNFRHKQFLTHHMKIYHSENYEPQEKSKKDITCPHCNKKFLYVGRLIRHMQIHDDLGEEEQEVNDEKLQADYEVIEEYSKNNIQNIYDECKADEYGEQPKEQSDENSEMKSLIIDIDPEKIQEMDVAQTSLISSKAEDKKDSEIKVEIHDDQGFMVIKVTPNDGGDEEK